MENGIVTKIIDLTPEMARQFLESSKGNRSLSWSTVKSYAEDMRNGNWSMNGEPMIIDEDGCIRDGHHRCEAVTRAGVTIKTLVVFGVSRDTKIFDIGRNRTYRDIAVYSGGDPVLHKPTMISLARFYYITEKAINKPSFQQVEDFLNRYKVQLTVMHDNVPELFIPSRNRITRRTSIAYSLLCAYNCGVKIEIIKRFVEIVNSGFYDKENATAAIVLRNMILQGDKMFMKSASLDAVKVVDNALKDYVNGSYRQKRYAPTNLKRIYKLGDM